MQNLIFFPIFFIFVFFINLLFFNIYIKKFNTDILLIFLKNLKLYIFNYYYIHILKYFNFLYKFKFKNIFKSIYIYIIFYKNLFLI